MIQIGTGVAKVNFKFQIGSARTLTFDFGTTDISGWTFQLLLKRFIGDRLNALSFTAGAGLTFPVYSNAVTASFTSTNTSIEEGEYYIELRRTDLNLALISGLALFTFDSQDGDSSSALSLSIAGQVFYVTISNVLTLTLTTVGTAGPATLSPLGVLNIPVSGTQQTLIDGATISWNVTNGDYAKITLGGNRTIANPTNTVNGGVYILELIQDSTGARTVTWGSNFVWSGGTAPTLTTTVSKRDFITFVVSNGKLYGVATTNFV